ncbi:hypothetical protein GGE07_002871 [Sinorhizobium terangae]|nr:hypothetical protein [Sinorhizobium terangae]
MSSWNSGRIIGQKPPLKPKEVWAIPTRLQMLGAVRDLALFNLAIDSKLRACDLVAISVADVAICGRVRDRAIIIQKKTGRPVQFESPIKRARLSLRGSKVAGAGKGITCFRAACTPSRICRRGNTAGSSKDGCRASGLIPSATARIR